MKSADKYTRYIILSTPRSGSNFLSQLLHSHGRIVSFGEIYNPYTVWGSPAETSWEHSRVMRLYRNLFPQRFLEKRVYRSYASDMAAVGFRLFYDHIDNTRFTCIANRIRESRDIRIIHLVRQNALRTAVSFLIAKKTGTWMLWESRKRDKPSVYIDPDACIRRIAQIQEWQTKYAGFFPDNPMITVTYEHLCTHTRSESAKILKFLRVPPRALVTDMVKQNPFSLREIVTNYSDLNRAVSATRWRHMLHE